MRWISTLAAEGAEVAQAGRAPAIEVDEDGRFGAMALTGLDEEAVVHLQVLRIDVDGDHAGTDVHHGFEGGPEGGVGDDHQVAGADPEGSQSQLKRVGTVGTGHYLGDAGCVRPAFFPGGRLRDRR